MKRRRMSPITVTIFDSIVSLQCPPIEESDEYQAENKKDTSI